MNRTIKFRAWDGKIMHYSYMIAGAEYCDVLTILQDEEFAKKYYKVDEWKVMQFTGLLDCEGKEIYEHDIVNVNLFGEQMTCVVLWRNDFYCYAYLPIEYAKESLEGWGDAFESKLTYHDEVTVLGNIYEHSNLLNN